MLITKTVKVKWNSSNIKHYESKGYKYTSIGEELIVKCEDLTNGSRAFVDIKCDCLDCITPINKPMFWKDYKKTRHEDGKYYCRKCTSKLFSGENIRKAKLLNTGSISKTHPELIKYFVNKEDTLNYSANSRKTVNMICPDCGHIETNRMITNLTSNGFSCPKCSDGISYPEKIMFNVLEQLEVDFKPQLTKITFDWCKEFKYDFYIPLLNCIIETHGMQHYKGSTRGRSLLVEQWNDKYKKVMAKTNGIKEENYITIDCRYSKLEFIKNNIINSGLENLYDLSNIDWLKCHEYACNTLVKSACDLWNDKDNKNNIKKVADKLKLCVPTIMKYLKQGAKLNWCDYDVKKQKQLNYENMSVSIICITTNEIFSSMNEAEAKYNIHVADLSACCVNKLYSAGKSENGERLIWQYYDEYLKTPKSINYITTMMKKVICVNTNEIFTCIMDIEKKYHIAHNSISACCKNKVKSAGKHPITNERMIWMYYEEYLKLNSQSIKEVS